MGINKGYNTADRSEEGDERYTPFYAVDPICKYLKRNSTIWCPFDEGWSAFNVKLQEEGHTVIRTHIDNGYDFFTTNPNQLGNIDYIISNPPFSFRVEVMERLFELNIPFAMLLPIPAVQHSKMTPLLQKNGLELLVFDKRINFHNINMWDKCQSGAAFATGYFCKGILPEKLVFEILKRYERKLK